MPDEPHLDHPAKQRRRRSRGSKIASGVWPMICQPPGESAGRSPVCHRRCQPTRADAHARRRAPRRRDRRVHDPQVRKPGKEPQHEHAIVTRRVPRDDVLTECRQGPPRPRGPARTRRRSPPGPRASCDGRWTCDGLACARSEHVRDRAHSVMSGSKYTATERKVETTSRTPAMPASRTTVGNGDGARVDPGIDGRARARSSSAESPASRMRDGRVSGAPAAACGECRRIRRWTSGRRHLRRGAPARSSRRCRRFPGCGGPCPAPRRSSTSCSADSRSASGSDERNTAATTTWSAAPNAWRNRPGRPAGTTKPSAARTPPRFAAPG